MKRGLLFSSYRRGEVSSGSFEELLPSQLGELEHLRVFERGAQLFMHFVGVRGGLKLGASAFRTFTRCVCCTIRWWLTPVVLSFKYYSVKWV